MIDARRMTPEQRVATVLAEMRPMIRHLDGPVWTASQDNVAKWIEILSGQRPRSYTHGWPNTECRVCGDRVFDVYVYPPPEKGICGLCCGHRLPDRDNRGDCHICREPRSAAGLNAAKEKP